MENTSKDDSAFPPSAYPRPNCQTGLRLGEQLLNYHHGSFEAGIEVPLSSGLWVLIGRGAINQEPRA